MKRRSFVTAGFIAMLAPLKPLLAYFSHKENPDPAAWDNSKWSQLPLHQIDDDTVRVEYYKRPSGEREVCVFVDDTLISQCVVDPKNHDESVTIAYYGKCGDQYRLRTVELPDRIIDGRVDRTVFRSWVSKHAT